jgi:hypothetical protein
VTDTTTEHHCAVCGKPATTADGIIGAYLCDNYDCLLTAWDRAAGTPTPAAPNHVRDLARIAYNDREGLGTTEGFKAAADAVWTSALTAAYRKIRAHADGYRDADLYKRTQDRAKTGSDGDRRIAAVHRSYASGIDAAGRTIAELLGIPEHEIEPVTTETETSQ